MAHSQTMLEEHLGYLTDSTKLTQYQIACENVVGNGDRVADLGCGVGILGMLCLKAGAAHSFEIEHGAIIDIARKAFTHAGYEDRTSFHRTKVEAFYPEFKVDVIVCDHVGYFGFDYGLIGLLQHAKKHILKTDGCMIPQRLILEAALISSSRLLDKVQEWSQPPIPQEFHFVAEQAGQDKIDIELVRSDFISKPTKLADIDLQADQDEFFSWNAEFVVSKDGPVHGIGGWFQCELTDDIWMSNSPFSKSPLKRRQVFLPVEPFEAKAGDLIAITIMARPESHFIAWDVTEPDGRIQSRTTWPIAMFSSDSISKVHPQYVAELNSEGDIEKLVLSKCDGRRTLGDLSELTMKEFPDRYRDRAEAMNKVVSVLSGKTL